MPHMPSTTRGADRHAAGPITRPDALAAPPRGAPAGASHASRVDAGARRSVPFAPIGGTGPESPMRSGPSRRDGSGAGVLVAVGPETPGAAILGDIAEPMDVNPLPIRGAKIHRPPLRDDILSRERLNGWLEHAVSGRLALIVAEAGFGKTTLLADWARHTSRRTAWYRLEADDRDWLTFIRHVVGSGRELNPGFAPETLEALLQVGPGGPTREELVTSLVHELADFGSAARHGFTLIFDDYHVIDGNDETEPIVRAILERTGPGFSVVIAGRSTPKLPLGRLRARKAVARLDGQALCFDVAEADRLFRDTYHHALEPDVLTDLIERTEGWAALLSLVHTNLEESKPQDPRDLIRQLNGELGDLYCYVAEEVISTIPARLRSFLEGVALLDDVGLTQASLIDDRPASEIENLITEAESRGLLARPDPTASHRFHPLVQSFLRSRLLADLGADGLRARHEWIAQCLENEDWRAAAAHYQSAGNADAAGRVVDASVERILMSGRFDDTRVFLDGSAGSPTRPTALLLRSRVELARGSLDRAVELAQAAVAAQPGGELAGLALLNVATVLGVAGFPDGAAASAKAALRQDLTPTQRDLAEATVSLWEAAHQGNLALIAEELRALGSRQDREGLRRYASISRLNLAIILVWVGDPHEALSVATRAANGLQQSTSSDAERAAAASARASALAYLGRIDEASRLLEGAASTKSAVARTEAMLELARVQGEFGDLEGALGALDRVGPAAPELGFAGMWALVRGQLALRQGDIATSLEMLDQLHLTPCHDVAGEMRTQLLRTRVAVATAGKDAAALASRLETIAVQQHSRPGRHLAALLLALSSSKRIGAEIAQLLPDDSAILSMAAEELAANLHRLSEQARARITDECRARPARWRTALRLAVRSSPAATPLAAGILSEIGTAEDLAVLRSLASGNRALRPHVVNLARLLAPDVVLRDLGAVDMFVGGQPVIRPLRRKVLGLLCFLGSRPNMAATRDEALDALWPDLGPDTAGNSLHQTIYFLRRVFEPDYREGYGAGYVTFDGDIVSLDPDLIDFTSRRCWRLIEEHRRTGRDISRELLETYAGRYALDFAYEDWATGYRETLHAATLGVLEAAIVTAVAERAYDRAIEIAHAVLRLDPDADSVELALIRAYRVNGSLSAAAEQYAHYSSVMRDHLGVEPPALDEL